jgi:excisionase family DNA binding protein
MSVATVPKFLSIQAVANRLGVTEKTVRNWVEAGHLPASQVVPRGRVLIAETDLARVLERRP